MKSLSQVNIAPPGGFKGIGTGILANPNGIGTFTNIISSAIGLLTIVAFIWFVFTFITGAIGIMTAGSDKQKLEGARQKIVNGIIGVVVVISAVFVISLIGTLFNISFLDLSTLFSKLMPQGGASTKLR